MCIRASRLLASSQAIDCRREFDHAQVRTEVSAGFREDGNQLLANLFGKNFKLGDSERFDIERGMDGIE